jgi:hypothetical protein
LADKQIAAASLPITELVAPFLIGPFRFLDRLFSGGRVTASFQLADRNENPNGKAAARSDPRR